MGSHLRSPVLDVLEAIQRYWRGAQSTANPFTRSNGTSRKYSILDSHWLKDPPSSLRPHIGYQTKNANLLLNFPNESLSKNRRSGLFVSVFRIKEILSHQDLFVIWFYGVFLKNKQARIKQNNNALN